MAMWPILNTGGESGLDDSATVSLSGSDQSVASGPRVAIYRTQILPFSETFVRDQALALRRWRPILVGEREIKALPVEGLPVQTAFVGGATLKQRATGMVGRKLGLPPPRMTGVVRHVAPRLIHAHFGFDGVEAWPIARRLGLPLLVTLHGSDITTRMEWFAQGRAGRRWQGYPARLARMARDQAVTFIAISENIRRAAIASGLPESRVIVQPIGINISRFSPTGAAIAERRPKILFLGRLVEKKGCFYLLEAFERIRARMPQAELIIGGDGPERAMLTQRASSISGVRFVGTFTRELATTLLAEARVFCLPSVTAESGDAEGLPLVILEAQASGVPVVTSARGGATEGIRDGETGFSFAERDVDALTERLMALLIDDGLATRFSAAAPGFIAENHDLFQRTAQLELLYDRAAGIRT